MRDPNDRYGLAPGFERAVVALAATSREFWDLIGDAVDPNMLNQPAARVVMGAVKAAARDAGGCPGYLVTSNRLFQRYHSGKLSPEEMRTGVAFLEDAFEDGLPDVKVTVAELRPVIKRALEKDALKAAYDAYARGEGDYTQTRRMLDKADAVGTQREGRGVLVGSPQDEAEIRALRSLDRLPTGVDDLDAVLNGGMRRGSVGLFIANTGVGKSIALAHVATSALLLGMHVGVVSTELARGEWLARIKAALTDVTIDEALALRPHVGERIADLHSTMGRCSVELLTNPTYDSVWRQAAIFEEDAGGRPLDVLVIDYLDEVSWPGASDSYTTGTNVTMGLRSEASKRGMWVWTAAQGTGRDKRHRIDTGDAAGSMGKPRKAQLVVTLNPRGDADDNLVELYVAKNTYGRANVGVEVHAERHMGRIGPSTLHTHRWREQPYAGI